MNKFIRDTLYFLKKQYGQPASIVRVISGPVNYATGVKDSNRYQIDLKKVIRLPDRSKRINIQIMFNSFKEGLFLDRGEREFIIDGKDLPSEFVPRLSDILITNQQEYKIKTIEELDVQVGYLISADRIAGET